MKVRALGTPMPLRKPTGVFTHRAAAPSLPLVQAARAIEELIASGGDGRLALNPRDQRNSYGCTPYPRPGIVDLASSTASSISQQAYVRAGAAQTQLWLAAARHGLDEVFDERIEAVRDRLRSLLGVADAEVVFSSSGTDAQLQALFLVKALLGGPLATVIVGADQTGSGTAYTARGQHFSDRTCRGGSAEKGAPIAGLCDQVRTVSIPFCAEAGALRSDAEMDAAVYAAVAQAAGRGEKILLQVMDASKLGWRAPSAACLEAVTAAWPGQVRVVVDACQMRAGRAQLQDYLARGYFVLVTGSKFFTGPAFAGALLVPQAQAGAIEAIAGVSGGFGGYTTRHDWPRRWHHLRTSLAAEPNFGQWLRWEATLEEMRAYFAVPQAFRSDLLKQFARQVPRLIGASQNLQTLAEQRGTADPGLQEELQHRTIHAFVPHRDGAALAPERCAGLYRAMGQDLSDLLAPGAPDRESAARICQIGQPVALRHRLGAALRLSASARIVSQCWALSANPQDALAPVLDDVRAAIEKLDWLIANPHFYEGIKA